MTTTVLIKHEGPDHNDVSVRAFDPASGAVFSEHKLAEGEEIHLPVYDTQAIVISEVPRS